MYFPSARLCVFGADCSWILSVRLICWLSLSEVSIEKHVLAFVLASLTWRETGAGRLTHYAWRSVKASVCCRCLQEMPRIRVRKTRRGTHPPDAFPLAYQAVIEGQSVRGAAKDYGLNECTLRRFIKKKQQDPDAPLRRKKLFCQTTCLRQLTFIMVSVLGR